MNRDRYTESSMDEDAIAPAYGCLVAMFFMAGALLVAAGILAYMLGS